MNTAHHLKSGCLADWQPTQLSSADIAYSTWIAFFAWTFAVYDFILFGTLLPVVGEHFNWDEAEQTEIATWVAIGGAIIAFVIGPIVDRIGRRGGIVLCIGATAICSVLTAVCAGMGKIPLILIRSGAGLGYAEEGINAVYLTEIYAATDSPKLVKRRGFIYSLVQSGWPVGALLAAGLTALLLPYIGWQGCFVFAAIPAFVIALLARRLKESPLFQVHLHLRQLCKAGECSKAEALAKTFQIEHGEHRNTGIIAAFRGSALHPTLMLSLALLLNCSTVQVFAVLGTSVIISVHGLSFENSLWILVLSNLIGFIGFLFHGWLGDRIGRRNTIAIGWMLGGLVFFFMIQGSSDFLPVIVLYSLGLFFLTGPYSALLFLMGESFPTAIRATGGAIVHAMGLIGAILASFGITAMLSTGGNWHSAALWFGALPCLLSGLVMWMVRHIDPESIQ